MSNTTQPSLELRGITKFFDEVIANDDVSFAVQHNTIHGIVGENGAGKSTIMKIVYGLYAPDLGEIWIRGERKLISTPHEAIALGIGMVHQHFMLIPTLSVWENVILGAEPSRLLRKSEVISSLGALQAQYGFSLELETLVQDLNVGHQQQVEILKLLYRKTDILILDEPTAVLTPQEVDVLFHRLKALLARGKTIILITHKLREILSFTDAVTVMRQGRAVETRLTKGLTEASLAELIVGRKLVSLPKTRPQGKDETVMRVEDVVVTKADKTILNHISFSVSAGEILGIAGVSGNGQQELVEVMANVRRPDSGRVLLSDRVLSHESTYYSRQNGLGLIAPHRHREAIIAPFSVRENLILGRHCEREFSRGPFFSSSKIATHSKTIAERFDIRPRETRLPIGALSGGNQQKVVVARETSTFPRLLIAAYPTRGVDIGAIEFIYSLFLRLRNEGAGIILLSTELDEIMELSDRIVVLFEGRITGTTDRKTATQAELGLWMTGGQSN